MCRHSSLCDRVLEIMSHNAVVLVNRIQFVALKFRVQQTTLGSEHGG
jgi:hypothetical protein